MRLLRVGANQLERLLRVDAEFVGGLLSCHNRQMKQVLGERRRKALGGSLRLAPTSKSGPASFFTASKNDDTLSMPACGSRTRMVLPLIWMLTGDKSSCEDALADSSSARFFFLVGNGTFRRPRAAVERILAWRTSSCRRRLC